MKLRDLKLDSLMEEFSTNDYKQLLWNNDFNNVIRRKGFMVNDWYLANRGSEDFVERLIKKVYDTFKIDLTGIINYYLSTNLSIKDFLVSKEYEQSEFSLNEKITFMFYMRVLKGCYFEEAVIDMIKAKYPNDKFIMNNTLDNVFKIDLVRITEDKTYCYQIKSYLPIQSTSYGSYEYRNTKQQMMRYKKGAICILITPNKTLILNQ